MARYYFDLLDDGHSSFDEEGLELSSFLAAQAEAAKALADMAREALTSDKTKRDMAIEVRDEAGPIMQVKFCFATKRLLQ